jgi:hypothetical protein
MRVLTPEERAKEAATVHRLAEEYAIRRIGLEIFTRRESANGRHPKRSNSRL